MLGGLSLIPASTALAQFEYGEGRAESARASRQGDTRCLAEGQLPSARDDLDPIRQFRRLISDRDLWLQHQQQLPD